MSILDKLIQKAEDVPLTGSEISEMSGGYRVIMYEELAGYQTIDDLLHGDAGLIILYQESRYSGHWVCIIDRGGQFEFFDSYGFMPDQELDYAHYMRTPLLSILLRKDGGSIIYNRIRLQRKNNDCGRFVALRLRFIDLTLQEFVNLVKDDRMAAIMTLALKH